MRAKQRLVVAHVLEHLDRHHAVERAGRRVGVDVGRLDGEVGRGRGAAPATSMKRALAGGVRDADDRCCCGRRAASSSASEPQPQPSSRMRMPSTKPARSIVRSQRGGLGGRQRRRRRRPTSRSCTSAAGRARAGRTRPAPRSAARWPAPGRGRRRRRRELAHDGGGGLAIAAAATRRRVPPAAAGRRRGGCPSAAGRVGQPAALGEIDRRQQSAHRRASAAGSGRGGHGTNALVVRW